MDGISREEFKRCIYLIGVYLYIYFAILMATIGFTIAMIIVGIFDIMARIFNR